MFVLLDYKLKKLRNYFGRESHTNLYFRQYALISEWNGGCQGHKGGGSRERAGETFSSKMNKIRGSGM